MQKSTHESNRYHDEPARPDVAGTIGITAIDNLENLTLLAAPEAEPFHADKMLIELRLFSGSRVFISSLDEYNVRTDGEMHPIPEEFGAYKERVARGSACYGAKSSAARIDTELRSRYGDMYDGAILREVVDFLSNNPRGARVCRDVGIETPADIHLLQAKDAIYLIGHLMHELTCYDTTDIERDEGTTRADNMSSLDIIRNGTKADKKEEVSPLGVCRNFADVAESLFAALKRGNPNLRNTYCFNIKAWAGATTGRFYQKGGDASGHAWLDFLTVGKRGKIAITTVDPTWVKKSGKDLSMFDVTRLRMGTHLRNIASLCHYNYSSLKQANSEQVSQYYEARVEKMVGHLKKKYGPRLSGVDPGDTVMQAAEYNAVEYIGMGDHYGGSAFTGVSDNILRLVRHAADNERNVFSPIEYASVKRGLQMLENRRPESKDEIIAIRNRLNARYGAYSAEPNYKRLFDLNELDGGIVYSGD